MSHKSRHSTTRVCTQRILSERIHQQTEEKNPLSQASCKNNIGLSLHHLAVFLKITRSDTTFTHLYPYITSSKSSPSDAISGNGKETQRIATQRSRTKSSRTSARLLHRYTDTFVYTQVKFFFFLITTLHVS